jgi:hypothetical protein
MNKCLSCGVIVDEAHARCPLCQREFSSPDTVPENRWYPQYTVAKAEHKKNLPLKIIGYLFFVLSSVCIVINLLSGANRFWSIDVLSSVLYGWLLIRHTILSKAHPGAKILAQVFGISGLLFVVNILTGSARWSVNYVFPFLVIAGTLLITIIIISKKTTWREYVGHMITLILLGFAPLILYAFGLSQVLWTAITAAMYASLTLVGALLFSEKGFKNELIRRFHF